MRGKQLIPTLPCCSSMPDCNQCNLLKLIYFLSSFAHKYSCCNSSISMTFGKKNCVSVECFLYTIDVITLKGKLK